MAGETKKRTRILIRSSPFIGDPKGSGEFYTALGQAIVLWGRFESHLDKLVEIFAGLSEVKPFIPDKIPISMKGRTKLLRELIREVPQLSCIKNQLSKLLQEAMEAAQDRHVIIHGHWNGFLDKETPTSRFVVWRRKGKKIRFETYDVDINSLYRMIKKFDDLNTRLVPITFSAICLRPQVDLRESVKSPE